MFMRTWELVFYRTHGKDIILHYLPTAKLAQESPTPWWATGLIKVNMLHVVAAY